MYSSGQTSGKRPHRASFSAPNPRAGGGGGIEVVNGPAAGVASVEGLLSRPEGRAGDRLVNLPVHHTGERPRLIDHPGNGIGKRGVLHPVENHRPHGHLTAVGLPTGLGGNDPGQQGQTVRLSRRRSAGGYGIFHPQRPQGGRSYNAVGRQAVFPLKILHRLGGLRPVNAVHGPGVIAPVFQLGLNGAHLLPGRTHPVCGRLRALGQGDNCDI